MHVKTHTDLLTLLLFPLDVSKSMSARQKLEAQVTENNIVKEVSTCLYPFTMDVQ